MNALKGLMLLWVCFLLAYASAVFAGAWLGVAYVSYTETINLFSKKAQEK